MREFWSPAATLPGLCFACADDAVGWRRKINLLGEKRMSSQRDATLKEISRNEEERIEKAIPKKETLGKPSFFP
jgi:hypothetical protein